MSCSRDFSHLLNINFLNTIDILQERTIHMQIISNRIVLGFIKMSFTLSRKTWVQWDHRSVQNYVCRQNKNARNVCVTECRIVELTLIHTDTLHRFKSQQSLTARFDGTAWRNIKVTIFMTSLRSIRQKFHALPTRTRLRDPHRVRYLLTPGSLSSWRPATSLDFILDIVHWST